MRRWCLFLSKTVLSSQLKGNKLRLEDTCECSYFWRSVFELFALLGCYATSVGSSLSVFMNNLLLQFSRLNH